MKASARVNRALATASRKVPDIDGQDELFAVDGDGAVTASHPDDHTPETGGSHDETAGRRVTRPERYSARHTPRDTPEEDMS